MNKSRPKIEIVRGILCFLDLLDSATELRQVKAYIAGAREVFEEDLKGIEAEEPDDS